MHKEARSQKKKKKKNTPTTSKGCKNETKSLCDSAAVSVTLTLRSALTAHHWRHIIYELANSPVMDQPETCPRCTLASCPF